MIISYRSVAKVATTLLLLCVTLTGCSRAARKQSHLGRAEQYFQGGDYVRARIEFLNVLQLDPKDAAATYKLGVMWLENGAPALAYPYLLRASESVPANFEAEAKLATTLVALGERAEARKHALAVLQQSPENDDALLALGDTVRTEADIAEAEHALWNIEDKKRAAYHLVWAKIAASKRDPAWTENELRQAVVAEPTSSRAHLALADFFLQQQRINEAEQEFLAAVELAPARSEARLKFAQFQATHRDQNAAKDYLRKFTTKVPDYLPAWQVLAEIDFHEKRFDAALDDLGKILAFDLDAIEPRLLQAEILSAKGETGKAVESLERLDHIFHEIPRISYGLARAYLQNNDPQHAESALQNALALSPDYADALLLLGQLNLHTGHPGLAVGAVTRLLEKNPGATQARALLVEAFESLGREEDAIKTIRDEVDLFPSSADAHFRLGVVLQKGKHIEEARAAFEEALELAPDAIPPWTALVELDLAEKNFQSATDRAKEKLAAQPATAAAHLMLGKVSFAEKDYLRAEEEFSAALDLDPQLQTGTELLISTYIAADKVAEAEQQLLSILSHDPEDARALTNLALLYHSTGQFPKARDMYERLLVLRPAFTTALNNLAYIYAEQLHEVEKGYDLARKARSLLPLDPAIADTLGWIAFRQAHYPEALTLMGEAAARIPDSPEIQYHLGMIAYMMDQPEVARTAFTKAVRGASEFPSRGEAERWLALLQDDSGNPRQFSRTELEALLAQRPDDVIARVRLGELLEKEGAIDQAAAAYEKALSVNPNLTNAALHLAQLYAGPLAKPEQALALAKRTRELALNDPKVAGVLGRIAYKVGNFNWAYDLLQMSSKHLTTDAEVLHDYAWAAYSMGRTGEARSLMERVIEAAPASQLSAAADVFLKTTAWEVKPNEGNPAEALSEKRPTADPPYFPALMAQAAIEIQKGAPANAINICNEILRRFPEFVPAQKLFATLTLGDESSFDKAYDLAKKARQALPDDPEVARALGELSYQKNQRAYALQLLQESAKRKPLDAKGLYFLGLCYLNGKQMPEGENALQNSLAAGLPEPFASRARTELEKVKPD